MAPTLSEDEIDDLLYFARTGSTEEFITTTTSLCARETSTLAALLLVAKDADSGNGPLHMAAANGHTETVNAILKSLSAQSDEQLAVINAQNAAGNTPLHWAAVNGCLGAVKALVDAGADLTVLNKVGHDAVYEAEVAEKTEVVEWVLKEGEGLEVGLGGGDAEEEDGDEGQDEGQDEEELKEGMESLDLKDEKKGEE